MPDDKVHVIARIQAKSGEDAKLRGKLQELVGASRKEPGCLEYDLFEEKKSPGTFFTFEVWASQVAIATHIQVVTPVIKDLMPIMAEPPDIRVLGGKLA